MISRLKSLQGPSREVDAEIAMALGIGEAFPTHGGWWFAEPQYFEDSPDLINRDALLPEYTASLDATVALVEKMNAKFYYRVEKLHPAGIKVFGAQYWATVGPPGAQEQATGPTAVLALLIALFTTLEPRT